MSQPYPFARRGISPVNKLICLSLLSVVLMVLDERYTAMQRAKEYIAGALYPLQWMAQQPVEWYEYGSALFQSQDYLLTENERLTLENSRLKIDLHRADMNARELEQLKSLAALGSHGLGEAQTAEVVSNGKEPLANRIIINKGSRQNIRAGDAVVDENGLVGQVSQSYPFSAEVHLLTDAKAVIPVMVARTGVRTLVYGGSDQLSLRYFPSDADLQPEDLLVTSGLDSVYPAGIPVAKVVQTGRNTGMPYYSAQLKPVAALRSSKYVLVLPQQPLPQTGETASDAAAAAASVPSAKP